MDSPNRTSILIKFALFAALLAQQTAFSLPPGFPDLPKPLREFIEKTEQKNAGEQCHYGQNEILFKLDLIRANTNYLDGYEYGAIYIPAQHEGVALYPSGTNYRGGYAIDFTNYPRTSP